MPMEGGWTGKEAITVGSVLAQARITATSPVEAFAHPSQVRPLRSQIATGLSCRNDRLNQPNTNTIHELPAGQ